MLSQTISQIIQGFLKDRTASGLSPLTIKYYTVELGIFQKYCDEQQAVDIEDITAPFLRDFLIYLAEERGRNNGGAHSVYRAVKALLRWWERETDDYRNPIIKVKAPKVVNNPIPGVPLDNVFSMVTDSKSGRMKERDTAILLTLIDSGLRAAEFCKLNIGDIDPITGDLFVNRGKGGKNREGFLGAETRKALRTYLRWRGAASPDDPLWITDEGDRLKYGSLRSLVRRRAKHSNLEDVPGLHDFRREFATRMKEAGVDDMDLAELMGHSRIETTRRYVSNSNDRLRSLHHKASPVDNYKPKGKAKKDKRL
jgi:integrase/recombinase XerD